MFSDLASLFHITIDVISTDGYSKVCRYSVKSSNHAFKKRSNWIDVEGDEKVMYSWSHYRSSSYYSN